MNAKLELKNLSFSFGRNKIVDDFSLKVEEGSFTTLLGPSGCGKTTLLRLISGFLSPDSGEIFIDGVNQNGIDVNERKVGMVFQDYALFPHLSVAQNISYGLKIKKNQSKSDDASTISAKVEEISNALGIEDLLKRFPTELSGGQQQRVALARSLILKPKLLLMDEPLSSLDTKLRIKVREELKEIQQKLKITTVYVTHDQEEALSLSTKIAVLDKGRLLQEGSPREIYFEPRSEFVADFVGKANILSNDDGKFMVRPEWFEISSNEGFISGTILSEEFFGSKTRFVVQTEKNTILADFDTISSENLRVGDRISLKAKKIWKI